MKKSFEKNEYDDGFGEVPAEFDDGNGIFAEPGEEDRGDYIGGSCEDANEVTDDDLDAMLKERSGKKKSIGEADTTGDYEDPMALFIRDIRNYPVLGAEEEKELARKAHAGDRDALDLLINSNQRLVLAIAWRSFRNKGLGIEDLVMAGNDGLRQGIAKFDPEREVRLATFVSYDIRKSMLRAIYNMGSVIRLPENLHISMAKVSAAEESLRKKTGRYPKIEEISKESGVRESTVRTLLFYKTLRFVPLDAPADEDNSATVGDRIPDERQEYRDANAEALLKKHLELLDPREKKVIAGYYGLFGNEKKSNDELAAEFGLSKQRISQIKIQAEKKLEKNGLIEELRMLL